MDLGIAGRSAIVCGSSRGLGFACAKALAGEGVHITLNGRVQESLLRAADDLRATTGVRVIPVVGDLREQATRDGLLSACPEPDILVTNSGGPPAGRLRDSSWDDWWGAINGNLLPHIDLIRRTIDGMCERRFGRIVNITSAMVSTPRPTMAVSSGVRAALTAVSKGLSLDVVKFNVTINNLQPERFDTDRQRHMAEVASTRDGITVEEARRRQIASIAADRLGDPDEFGAACAFLCGTAAGYISGQSLRLDGGSYPGLL